MGTFGFAGRQNAIGNSGNPSGILTIDGLDLGAYSAFSAGAPAFKISAHSSFFFGGSPLAGIRGSTNPLAGNLEGPGVDGSQGAMQPLCVGGGGKNIEGAACLQGSQGAANSGALLLYDTNNVQQGLVGAANAAGLNVNASNGTVFLNSKNGTASATAKFGANASSQNLVNLSPLPTTPPSGTGGLYVCVDNAGSLYVKASCP